MSLPTPSNALPKSDAPTHVDPVHPALSSVPLAAALQQAETAIGIYREEPAIAANREHAIATLRAVASVLVSGGLPGAEAGTRARDLLRTVMASGLYDAGADDADIAVARGYTARGESGLIAAMLLVPAWQWPDLPPLASVPASVIGDYVGWLFVAPQGFVVLGQAADYPRRALVWLGDLLHLVKQTSDPAVVRDAVMAYLRHGNCIPWYFCEDSLRRNYELRAQLLQCVSRRAGVDVAAKSREGRPLRVGFLNRHFGPQTETYTTLPMFEQLDPDRFEVQLFATHADGSALEEYIRRRVSAFHVLPEDPAAQLNQLRAADLDVLVFGTNLTAVYHEIARLALHRIAPLQVVNNSSCTTTGFPEIDLYVSGTLTELPNAAEHFTERLGLVAGPAHAFNYEADRQEPAGTWSRAALGIPEDAVVFVSAANYFKVIPEMRQVWARLLAKLPGSRLLLHPFNPNWSSSYPIKRFSAELDQVLQEHGVATDRLILSTQTLPTRSDVKELLRVGDVYLDTFPFGGVNSLVDPLELGMPVVVWEGSTFRSRMGGALLRSLGLDGLIATDEAGYVAIAAGLGDRGKREELTGQINDRMSRAPVFLDPLAASDAFGALLVQAYDELARVGRTEFRRRREPVRTPVLADPLARVQAGVEKLEQEDFPGATAAAAAVLAADPANVAARHLMGAVLLRQGRTLRAVDYLLGAVQRADPDASLWHDLAVALHESGRKAQAVQALEACIRLDPKRLDSWLLLAQVAEAAGNRSLQEEAHAVARQLAPSDEPLRDAHGLPAGPSAISGPPASPRLGSAL